MIVKRDETGKVIAFTIDRKYHGVGNKGGRLLNPKTGLMCCLGHYSIACDVTPEEISDKSYPCDIRNLPEQMKWLVGGVNTDILNNPSLNSPEATKLAKLNDMIYEYPTYNPVLREQREREIAEQFAQRGITVTFIGEAEQ